jgi:hypothetical protein
VGSSTFADLSIMDHAADGTLPTADLARYTAYRNALIADGQDSAAVVELLALSIGADGRLLRERRALVADRVTDSCRCCRLICRTCA